MEQVEPKVRRKAYAIAIVMMVIVFAMGIFVLGASARNIVPQWVVVVISAVVAVFMGWVTFHIAASKD